MAIIDIHKILKQYFGFSAFRAQQEEIIRAVLEGNDVLALLPTGGGKSICYQVPALAKEGICLVVSPLIALMKDQIDHLHRKNITAFSLHSGQSFYEVRQTFKAVANSNCKFFYVSPERLQTKLFKEWLPSLNINLIAVDEAHCISQWGYDFRPPYLKIAEIRSEFPKVPIIALTASATPDVQQDICEKLIFKNYNVFRQSFAKPNLSFSSFRLSSKYNKLKEILQKVPGSALVYCKNRKRTKDIAALLQSDNISASFYHAGLTAAERSQRQQDWINNQTRVMVCTNAFGMGIDKPDVRVVVHVDVPECLENYYQEAGRAGRDGKKAYAVLLYSDAEMKDMEKLSDQKFPLIYDIRKVYQSLCNYLQIPEGSGEGEYFDFDIKEFCLRWKLEVNMVMNVLKTLEQAGYLAFSETVFTSSKIEFITGKEYLHSFENEKPLLIPIIKCLLRTYEGIFTNIVSINENAIAKTMHQTVDDIKKQLQLLTHCSIINYQPQKDSPQVCFLYNRIAKEEITIDQQAYKKRKSLYEYRIRNMIRYAVNMKVCRSEMVRKYFGEKETEACGICDACLNKSKNISLTQIQEISEQIKNVLAKPMTLQQILIHFTKTKKEVVELAIQNMIMERLIEYDLNGCLFAIK